LKRHPQKNNYSRNISSPRERNTTSLAASTSLSKSIHLPQLPQLTSPKQTTPLSSIDLPTQINPPPQPYQPTKEKKVHSLDQQPVADSRQSSILQNSIFQCTLELSLPSHGLIEWASFREIHTIDERNPRIALELGKARHDDVKLQRIPSVPHPPQRDPHQNLGHRAIHPTKRYCRLQKRRQIVQP
jgi:hypothetical protein